eukprot:501779_1
MTPKVVLALALLHALFMQSHGRISLIRKSKNNNKQRRRRLSLLMDSFVDPVISDDYFYAVLYVGSPQSQRVEMALDTGSGLPYFACSSTCTHCGKHDDKPYILENSTSFEWISCKDQLCGGGRCKNNVCEWTQRYVDKSSISAVVGSDLMSFYQYPHLPTDYYRITDHVQQTPHNPLQNEKKLRLTFGCSEHEANTIYRQGADGVMGLSMHHRSFVDQLFNTNARNNIDLGAKQFAHCFGDQTGGLLLFGSIEIDDLIRKFNIKPIWTPFITAGGGHGWYRVKTVGFTVRRQQSTQSVQNEDDMVTVNYASNLKSGYHGSVIDTGSSTLSMPRKASSEIMNAILKLVSVDDKFEWVADGTKNYDYFLKWNGKLIFTNEDWKRFSEEKMKYFADIVMLWQGDGNEAEPLEFSIPVQTYLLYKKPHVCLDLFGDTPSILVGSNVMTNKFMIYDRDKMKLGVADIDCDALVTHSNIETTVAHTETEDDTIDLPKVVDTVMTTTKGTAATKKQTTSKGSVGTIIDRQNHVVIRMTAVYDVYLKYCAVLFACSLCLYCLYIGCRKWRKNSSANSRESSRSNIRYQTVSTTDPDLQLEEAGRKIYNHRRKKPVTNSASNSFTNIRMDNMLSQTTPTQNFTSITLQHHANSPEA